MIKIRQLEKKDNNFFNKLIYSEGLNYNEYLKMGWTLKEIKNQFDKSTNLSFGVFYKELMVSFIFGDLINIEKKSEYEILLIYVCKNFRKKGLGTKLLEKIEENSNCLKKIHLEVSKNNLQGILFYKNMGFKNIYTRRNYLLNENKKTDALVMLKNY